MPGKPGFLNMPESRLELTRPSSPELKLRAMADHYAELFIRPLGIMLYGPRKTNFTASNPTARVPAGSPVTASK
jgi:hypothetical protein